MTSAMDQKTAAILAAFNSKPYKNEVVRYDAPQALTAAQKAQARENIGGFSRNIGEIVTSTLPLTDAGLHLLDGSVIQGNGIYSDFVTYIAGLDQNANYFCTESEWQASVSQYGVCGKFVYDSVNETVRLPKITGITEGTTDLTALGDLVQAGLPNITGSYAPTFSNGSDFQGSIRSTVQYASGAFYRDSLSSGSNRFINSNGSDYSGSDHLSLDASRSSPIYGNSATVQPQTVKCFVYIVIATGSKTQIQVDIDEIATDLNSKVDISSPQTITGNKNFTGALQKGGKAVETVNASGSGYIRYESGLQICWGFVSNISNTVTSWGSVYQLDVNTPIVFPVPFIGKPSVSIIQAESAANGAPAHVERTATQITSFKLMRPTDSSLVTNIDYIAIGKWK